MVLFTNWPRYTWRFAWPLITRYSLNQSWRFVNNSIPFWKQVHRVILNENEIQSNFDIEVLQCTFSVKIEDAPKKRTVNQTPMVSFGSCNYYMFPATEEVSAFDLPSIIQ